MLHRYDWSETSLVVELFTRERGRVVVAAKGAKRPTSQLRPVLLPFQRLAVQLGRPPADPAAELRTLRSAEWAGRGPPLAAAALFAGFYLNELLLKLLARDDDHPRLFDLYADTLAALADEQPALRAFELVLLRELGVLPELALETPTQAPLGAAARYALHPEAGLVAAAGTETPALQGRQWGALEEALVVALASGEARALRAACAAPTGALRGALRNVVQYHLGSTPLRTRLVMQDVQRLVDPPALRR